MLGGCIDMLLFILAVFPVLLLCYYVYAKDNHKEPKGLLIKIFLRGVLTCFPVVIFETLLSIICPVANPTIAFPILFINVFISIALVEEGAKWIVTKYVGYRNSNFDEIYDIIVYSVFASLGFACIENILYVFQNGIGNAIVRAITSIPGHACFGIAMGYYLAKARVNEINNNKSGAKSNLVLSLLVPTLLHTIYDAILLGNISIALFFAFDITMVIICFRLINKMSKVQFNISYSSLGLNNNGHWQQLNNSTNLSINPQINNNPNFCPMCGMKNHNHHFCTCCGYKLN